MGNTSPIAGLGAITGLLSGLSVEDRTSLLLLLPTVLDRSDTRAQVRAAVQALKIVSRSTKTERDDALVALLEHNLDDATLEQLHMLIYGEPLVGASPALTGLADAVQAVLAG